MCALLFWSNEGNQVEVEQKYCESSLTNLCHDPRRWGLKHSWGSCCQLSLRSKVTREELNNRERGVLMYFWPCSYQIEEQWVIFVVGGSELWRLDRGAFVCGVTPSWEVLPLHSGGMDRCLLAGARNFITCVWVHWIRPFRPSLQEASRWVLADRNTTNCIHYLTFC